MKLMWLIGAPVILLLAVPPQSADVRFRAAQQKENVEGDLNAAIRMYRQISDDRATPPDIAARALLRLGKCYQRMGSAEARKAYERIVAQFGGQDAAVAEAKQLLASIMRNGAAPNDGALIVRKLRSGIQTFYSTRLTDDGQYAAVTDGSDLDLLNVVTGERNPIRTDRPITSSNERIYVVSMSPDGRRIVVEVPTGTNTSELRLVDRHTGQVRTLVKSDTAFRILPMDWSRDSRTILVRAVGGLQGVTGRRVSGELFLIDVVTGHARVIAESGEMEDAARISPDGQFIAYTVYPDAHDRGIGKLFVERIDGSDDQLIAAPESGALLAGWSPDGRYLLFTTNDLGAEHLWAIRVNDGRPDGQPVSLARGLPQSSDLATTSSGSLIATIVGGLRYYVAPIDPTTGRGGVARDINARLNAQILGAAWSPNGREMVYSALRNRADEKPMQLYLRDEGTGGDRLLGSFPMVPRKLSWAPDGKSLILARRVGKGSGVFRYFLNDGRTEQMTPDQADAPAARSNPRLSPDGRTLFYGEGAYSGVGMKLIRHDLTTGGAQSIATFNHNYDLSPDGEYLVVPFFDSEAHVMVLRVIAKSGQPVRDLIRMKPGERIQGLAWSPDGRWIYFGRGNDRGLELHRVAAGGGASTSTGLRTSSIPDIIVHPDGTRIAYLDRGPTELWRIDGVTEALARLP